MVTAKIWTISERPSGLPASEHFKCIEETLPSCSSGDIIIEAECLSVDPYMRYRIRQMELGSPITGSQVARVIESQNEDYPVGTYVIGYPGWRTHTHLTKEQLSGSDLGFPYMKVPDLGNNPKSAALGVLGMPGNTAYFGFLDICNPKEGETVLVNGAAGAVGSYVCQIAKIKGCKVIAFAGSEAKVEWLKGLGVDHAFNYKTTDVTEAINKAAPEGVHCYFDNVGGEFTAKALPAMALRGRISVCGAISTYNDESKDVGSTVLQSPFNEGTIIWKQLRIEGFIVLRWIQTWMDGINQMKAWIEEGKLKYEETITKGFENMPRAFLDLFHGKNLGKAIVQM